MDLAKKAIKEHKKLRGKISVISKRKIASRSELGIYYTPGVGAVSKLLSRKSKSARDYTIKGNSVAIISDGSAVLGLGNIGPYGALPVMEGKAMLFKQFADVDAFPIVLDTQDVNEIVETVERISPAFGGINLEDISAPRCFEIEKILIRRLPIPVFHDDQHGTAIVVLAGVLNAAKVVKKKLERMRIVIIGAGAAGTAISRLLYSVGVKNLYVLDRQGLIYRGRKKLPEQKKQIALYTNPDDKKGDLKGALAGADVVVGVSGPRLLLSADIKTMNNDSIVFALSNPVPEIMPEEAKSGGAVVVATGRSDFPNQVNNSLVFPGMFRGALDQRIRQFSETMKKDAARKLAGLVAKPTRTRIIPDMFDKRVAKTVARAIR